MTVYKKGLAFFCLGIFLQACMDAFAKWLGQDYSVWEIMVFRTSFGILPILVLVKLKGGSQLPKLNDPFGQILRGSFTVAAGLCFFASLQHMSLAEATTIFYISPIFMVLLGWIFMKEAINLYTIIFVVAGFFGVVVIYAPSEMALELPSFLPLAAATFYALSMMQIRRLSFVERPESIVLYGSLVSLAISLLGSPLGWQWPNTTDLSLLLAMGLCGGLAVYFFAVAFWYVNISDIAVFEYSAILWATLLGYLVWDDWPEARIWVGAILISGAGIMVAMKPQSGEQDKSDSH
jgi:drug/metabolite transporter (DMT)-like permease